MNKHNSALKTRLLLLPLFIILYTVYYTIDIYSWYPIAISVFAVAALIIIKNWMKIWKRVLSSNIALSESVDFNPARRRKTAFIIAAVLLAALLISGKSGNFIIFAISQTVKLVTQPFAYMAITWTISSGCFYALLAASLCAGIFPRKRFTFRGAALYLFDAFWIMAILSLVFILVFKQGPAKNSCRGLKPPPGMRLVFGRDAIDSIPGMDGALPYDSASDEKEGLIFFSLKQTNARPGAIAVADSRTGKLLSFYKTNPTLPRTLPVNAFPERMSINTARKELYTLVLSPSDHRLLVLSYSGKRLRLVRNIYLSGEPNNLYTDLKNRRIYVFYAGADRHGYDVYNADDYLLIKEFSPDGLKGSAQHVAYDAFADRIFVTIIGPRKKLIEINPSTMQVVRSMDFTLFLEGVVFVPSSNRIFTSSPFTREIISFGAADFKKSGSSAIRCGLADMVYEPVSNTISVAGYNGEMDIFTVGEKLKLLKKLNTGYLLRNVSPDSGGRFYACSGCGVFEITPDKFK